MKYLLDYLESNKNSCSDKYRQMYNKRCKIKKKLLNIKHNEPVFYNMCKKGYCTQEGGNDISQRLMNILDMINKYKKLPPTVEDTKKSAETAKKNLEQIENMVEEIQKTIPSPDSNVLKDFMEETFQNSLKTTITSLENTDSYLKLNQDNIKIDVPTITNPNKLLEKFNHNTTLKKLEESQLEFDALKKEYEDSDKQNNNKLEKLKEKIKEKVSDRNKDIDDLTQSLTKIDNELRKVIGQITSRLTGLDEEYSQFKSSTDDYYKVAKVFDIYQVYKKISSLELKNTEIEDFKVSFVNMIDKEKKNYEKDKGVNKTLEQIPLDKKHIIDLYNANMPYFKNNPSTKDKVKELPLRLFDGTYAKRVDNKLFTSEKKDVTTTLLTGMCNENKDKCGEIFKDIYSPDLIQEGGKNIAEDIEIIINESVKKEINFYKLMKEFYNNVNTFNVRFNHYVYHTVYMTVIITNQIVNTSSYTVYSYINKGLLEYYYEILKSMVKEVETSSFIAKHHLRKYHYVTIHKLYSFIETLLGKIGDNDKIDIEGCGEWIRYNFILFNHFRKIMDQYRTIGMKPITIYARINDFGDALKTYPQNRMFASDYYLEDNIKKEPCRDRNIDYRRLVVQKNKCNALGSKSTGNTCVLGSVDTDTLKFTRVFDSKKFKEVEAISNHMALQTMLISGKGTAVLTYGYSGVGKTFTLFGDKSKDGMLQSTLNGISGLDKLYIRVFELYGKGVPFSHYWEDKDNVFKKIYSYSLSLSEKGLEPSKVQSEVDITEFMGKFKNLKTDPENKDDLGSYLKIDGSQVKDVFKNFENLVTSIDTDRMTRELPSDGDDKIYPSIRETPNNPESSRSMMVYDFQLVIESTKKGELTKNIVPFIIIDLPGREEITETFVDTFLDKPITRLVLGKNAKIKDTEKQEKMVDRINAARKDELELRLALGSFALNPFLLPAVYMSHLGDDSNEPYKLGNNRLAYKTGVNQIYNIILRGYNSLSPPDKKIIYDGKGGDENILDIKIGKTGSKEFTIRTYFEQTFNKNGNLNILKNKYFEINHHNSRRDYIYDFQYFTGLCIAIINRMMKYDMFEQLENIYKQVMEYVINKRIKDECFSDKLVFDKIKEYINDYPSYATENTKKTNKLILQSTVSVDELTYLKKVLYERAKFDYITTPSEGIFINENIIGLLKKLENLSGIKDDNSNIKGQKESEYEKLQLVSRSYVKLAQKDSLYTGEILYRDKYLKITNQQDENNPEGEKEQSDKKTQIYFYANKNPEYNLGEMRKMYFKIKGVDYERTDNNHVSPPPQIDEKSIVGYQSDRIFNSEKPLITDILEPYTDKIDDYKVFYLLSNHKSELKCEHQYKLLKNTQSFIKSIVPQ